MKNLIDRDELIEFINSDKLTETDGDGFETDHYIINVESLLDKLLSIPSNTEDNLVVDFKSIENDFIDWSFTWAGRKASNDDICNWFLSRFKIALKSKPPLTEEKPVRETESAKREFYQVGLQRDVVGEYFKEIHKRYQGNWTVEVVNFKQSDTRITLFKADNRTQAFVIETRTEYNDLEFICGQLPTSKLNIVEGEACKDCNGDKEVHSFSYYGSAWMPCPKCTPKPLTIDQCKDRVAQKFCSDSNEPYKNWGELMLDCHGRKSIKLLKAIDEAIDLYSKQTKP